MADISNVALLVGVATAVNVTARVREGKEPASPIIGAVILFAFLATIGSIWRWDIVYAIALLFVISSFVIKGKPFVAAVTQLVQGVRN